MSGKVERSRIRAACSTVAGVLIASAEVVSSAARFFAPHPKKQPTAHATKTFSITVREQRWTALFIARDAIETTEPFRAPSSRMERNDWGAHASRVLAMAPSPARTFEFSRCTAANRCSAYVEVLLDSTLQRFNVSTNRWNRSLRLLGSNVLPALMTLS